MNNRTVINESPLSNATQLNNTVNNGPTSSTIVNSALYNLSQIPVGTILCGKYKVVSQMNILSGEASLFICEYNEEKYVAKIYRRDVAIKEDVTTALKNINSPFVAKLFDTGVYNGLPFEIIPYYEKGSLQGHTFSFDELKQRIIPSLNEGLHVLHSNGIIHKDLKPSNIMLCDNEEDVVIIDFGISSVKGGSNTVIVTKTGMTPEYSASETFRNLFLEESDYYSLGITLYELFCGRTPYSNMSSEEIEQYVSIQRIPFPSNMPTDLCNLIAGLTYNDITYRKNKSNPNRRWTYDEVKNWCKGKYQQIPGEGVVSAANQIPTYTFLKQKYTNMTALVNALASNWNEGKKQLFRGLLSGFFKTVDPEIAGYCMDAEDAQAKGGNPDFLFFQTLYKISPTVRTIYWKENHFDSLPELGNSILEHLRNEDRSNYGLYDELLSRHVISEYISLKNEKSDDLIKAAKSLEDRFSQHHADEHEKELSYYLTGYMLSGQRTIVIQNKVFSSVDEIVEALHQKLRVSENEFQAFCDQLIDSTGALAEQFEAWLITLGKHEELQKWRMSEYGA
ncbi:MAG: protein kinase domain-containing protein [Eubacteriales bacterium]|jgi:serine/threonine protein kinase